MIDNDEITAVSDLRILSLILIEKTLLYLRIFSLSSSEKSPSGPTKTQIGFSSNLLLSNFLFFEFKSVKTKLILLEFKNSFKV